MFSIGQYYSSYEIMKILSNYYLYLFLALITLGELYCSKCHNDSYINIDYAWLTDVKYSIISGLYKSML